MKQKVFFVTLLLLLLAFFLPVAGAEGEAADGGPQIRVGLYYDGSGDKKYALPSANLENSTGTGYRFGYYDDALVFFPVASTGQTKISMIKAQNIYLLADYTYSDVRPESPKGVVGCYHIQLPDVYQGFEEASAAAQTVGGGFVAWIAGEYFVRTGAYESGEQAAAAMGALGSAGAKVVGTSVYAVTVTATGTSEVIFQFDGGETRTLGVVPGLEAGIAPLTWFKNNRYCGGFRYQRLGGGNLTVVNVVRMEDYVRGILPHEMSPSWPLEALKAQAVTARTFARSSHDKHASYHFDVCTSTDCQVYQGVGSANENTDRAVAETAGQYVWYNGTLAQTYYYSCNGGGSEDVKNVWEADLPYLKGVIDPYEPTVKEKTYSYGWSYSFSREQLSELLKGRGYSCDVADFYVSARTATDNVYTITFVDSSGKTYTFSKDRIRTILNIKSIRFTIAHMSGGFSINGTRQTDSLSGLYAIGADGTVTALPSVPYVLTGGGPAAQASPTATDTYVLTGSGWGHQVGMSQWGAYAMAQQGLGYLDILHFYYTNIEVY